MSIRVTSGASVATSSTACFPFAAVPTTSTRCVPGEQRLDGLDEERLVVGYEYANRLRTLAGGGFHGRGFLPSRCQSYAFPVPGTPQEQIQKLLVTGDNRLKQGVSPEKARASYEQALDARPRGRARGEACGRSSRSGWPTSSGSFQDRLDPLRLTPDVVLRGGRLRRGVRPRQRCRSPHPVRERRRVQGVDEDAGFRAARTRAARRRGLRRRIAPRPSPPGAPGRTARSSDGWQRTVASAR